jgi:glycosyltransferase involved in cell wall biosynthesis
LFKRRGKRKSGAEVHQFIPSLGYRDASGNHTIATKRALDRAELRGEVWAISIHPEMNSHSGLYRDYAKIEPIDGPRALLYQAGTGAQEMVDFLIERPEPKFIYYHNITPASFFEPYDPAAALQMQMGREELGRIAKHIDTAMANSEYSARELRELDVENVTVVPPYLPPHHSRPSRSYLSRLQSVKRGIDVLFVGRVAPNKGHVSLMRAFAALRSGCDDEARLFIVGAWGPGLYMAALQRMRERVGEEGIILTGSVTEAALAAHYESADVFVCLSEHEGFKLPIVEAMRVGVPVIAYDAGAVADTMGGAGVLLKTLDPFVIAETIHRVVHDEALRADIVGRQKARATVLENYPRDEEIVAVSRRVLGL